MQATIICWTRTTCGNCAKCSSYIMCTSIHQILVEHVLYATNSTWSHLSYNNLVKITIIIQSFRQMRTLSLRGSVTSLRFHSWSVEALRLQPNSDHKTWALRSDERLSCTCVIRQEECPDFKILGYISIRSMRTYLHQRRNESCAR